jgi:hypothetical protein
MLDNRTTTGPLRQMDVAGGIKSLTCAKIRFISVALLRVNFIRFGANLPPQHKREESAESSRVDIIDPPAVRYLAPATAPNKTFATKEDQLLFQDKNRLPNVEQWRGPPRLTF